MRNRRKSWIAVLDMNSADRLTKTVNVWLKIQPRDRLGRMWGDVPPEHNGRTVVVSMSAQECDRLIQELQSLRVAIDS